MPLSAARINVGDRHEAVVVDGLTRTQIVQYAGASGDYNPLHTDEVYAQHAGYPGVFAHGMLTMAMTARLLTDLVGDGQIMRYGVRFARQVWPGDTLTAAAIIDAIREESGQHFADFLISTKNQDGEEVLSGYATARIHS
jgi:acyl dehydratase